MQQALGKQTLQEFVFNWNKSHKRLNFLVNYIPVIDRPTSIEIRFSTVQYRKFLTTDMWEDFKEHVRYCSHNNMYVVTNQDLYEKGVINIAVASSNHNYRECFVVSVLKWMTEQFFLRT